MAIIEDEGIWEIPIPSPPLGPGVEAWQVEVLLVCSRTRRDFHYLLFGHALFAGSVAQEQHAASHAVNTVSHPAGVSLIVTDWCQHGAEGKQK